MAMLFAQALFTSIGVWLLQFTPLASVRTIACVRKWVCQTTCCCDVSRLVLRGWRWCSLAVGGVGVPIREFWRV